MDYTRMSDHELNKYVAARLDVSVKPYCGDIQKAIRLLRDSHFRIDALRSGFKVTLRPWHPHYTAGSRVVSFQDEQLARAIVITWLMYKDNEDKYAR